MDALDIISYNCQSFRKNLEIIRALVDKCDVLLLQETLLPTHALDIAESLNVNYNIVDYYFVPASREENCFVGRSRGGLAIIWKKTLTPLIKTHKFNDRVCGISISTQGKSFLLLNVYMPCDYRNMESLLYFRSTLADLRNILDEKADAYDDIILAGDWNADPSKGRFFAELKNMVEEYFLILTDIVELPSSSHTYISLNSAC